MAPAFNVDLKNLLDLSIDPVHGTINLYHLHGLLSGVILKLNRSPKSSEIHSIVDKNKETPVIEADVKKSSQSNPPEQQIEPEVVIQHSATNASKTGEESSTAKPRSVIDQLNKDTGDPTVVKKRVDSPKIEISIPDHENLNPEILSSVNKENKTTQQDENSSTPIQNPDDVTGEFKI